MVIRNLSSLERFLTFLAQKDVATGTEKQAFNAFLSRCREDRREGVPGCRTSNFIRAEFIFKQPGGATAGRASRVLP
jgi:hypothetical protein